MRTSPCRMLLLALIVVVVASSCATYSASTVNVQRTPLEQAKLNYVTGAMDYDFSLKIVRELRAARLLNDAQWSRVEKAASIAQEWAPLVEKMLAAWEQFCLPDNCPAPPNYHAAETKLGIAFAEVVAVKNEAQK